MASGHCPKSALTLIMASWVFTERTSSVFPRSLAGSTEDELRQFGFLTLATDSFPSSVSVWAHSRLLLTDLVTVQFRVLDRV